MKTESEREADVLRLEAENRKLRGMLEAVTLKELKLASELMTARGQLEYVLAMLRNLYDGVRREQEQQTRRTEP